MKPSVLFLVPSLARAGAETQLVNLVNGLDASEFRKILISFEPQTDLVKRLDVGSVEYHCLHRNGRLDWALIKEIAKIIEHESVDLIHCTLMISLFYGFMAQVVSRRKPELVAALHTTKNRNFRATLFDNLIYQWFLRRCGQVIFVCESQREHWCSRYPFLKRRSVRIYNGIDTEKFANFIPKDNGKSSLGIPPSACVVTCVAAMRPEKGHEVLIEAMAQLGKGPDELVLLLAGDGVRRRAVELLVQECKLEAQVKFLGNIADVRDVLVFTDFCVLPSVAVETFSMAMLEAFAMSVPMVASDIGGIGEAVINDITGRLVPPGNVPELAQAMKMLIEDRELRLKLGHNACSLVAERFGEKQMIEQTSATLKSLLAAS